MTEPTKRIFADRIEWRLNGEIHREDGPAMEYADGFNAWYRHGKLHRVDGPAIEYVNGTMYWFLDGIEYTEEEWFKEIVRRWSKP